MTRYISLILSGFIGMILLMGSLSALPYPTTTPSGETASGKFNSYFTNTYRSAGIFDSSPSYTNGCAAGQVVRGFTTQGMLLCILPYWSSIDGGINIYFTGAGNVGIGIATTTAKLQVASSNYAMHLGEGIGGAGIDFKNRLATIPSFGTLATIAWLESTSGLPAGSLLLSSRPGVGGVALVATGSTANLYVSPSSGNIGIGTIAPGARLEVAGQMKITGGTPGLGKILSSDATGLASWISPSTGDSSDNLVNNSDFEMGDMTGWGGTASVVNLGSASAAGTYVLVATGARQIESTEYIPVSPTRDALQLEGYFKKSILGTTPGVLYFGYIAYDANKAAITTAPCGTYCYFAASASVVPADGIWHKYSSTTMGEGTAYPNFPVGTKYVRVLALLNYAGSADTEIQVDHISLKRINYGSLFVGNNYSSTNLVDQYQLSKIYTTATNNLILEPTGNIGIGTTTPGAKLEIAGTIKITGGTPGAGKILTSDATGLASWENPSDMPIGAVVAFNTATCPTGWVAANGSGTIDLRGEFIRGLDSGRGVDIGRILGSAQVDLFKSHTHNSAVYGPGGAAAYLATTYNSYFDATTQVTGATGGAETRPRNVALLYCTKISSSTSTVSNNTTWSNVTGTSTGDVTLATTGNVGVGTTAPTAKLEVAGQVKITGGAPGVGKILTSDATGLASWQSAGSSGWGLTGNAGTTAATNFVGTTDNNDLVFKRNNIEGMRLSGASGNLVTTADALINGVTVGRGSGSIATNTANGYGALYSNTTGQYNTANGYRALYSNTTATSNLANGAFSLQSNTTGVNNTANGVNALQSNITGIYNTANGMSALNVNTTGNFNTANGVNALASMSLGENNTANGVSAGYNLTSGDNNIAIGANTPFPSTTGSNQLNIGNWIYGTSGNIGIGTTTPGAKLEIAGTIKITGGTPGAGKILTSDATGLASWENPSDMPIGAVVAFNTATCPTGWVAANGSGTIDLRGEFIRGLDSGRGVDTGRVLGTAQTDLFKSHVHNYHNTGNPADIDDTAYNNATEGILGNTFYYNGNQTFTRRSPSVQPTGGTETRPRNVALLYCTKISSSTSTVSNNTTWSNITGTSTGNVTLATTGNVGIGTTGPTAKLEINSGVAGSGGLRFTNLTSTSATGATNGKMLTVNGSGDVILVDSPTLVSANLVKLYGEAWNTAAGKINNASGYSFTVPTSGRYLFDFVSTSYASSAMKTTTFAVRNGTTVLASDSDTSFNNLVHVEYSGKMEVDLVAGTTYNVIVTDSGVKNSGDWERVYYKQVGGVSSGGTGSTAIADLPIGSVMGFNLATCPTGWVLADGSGGTLDLRGEFIRGLDSGRGVDTGRVLGTAQTDLFKSHVHNYHNTGNPADIDDTAYNNATEGILGNTFYYNGNQTFTRRSPSVQPTGGTETRPRNVALLYCMKLTSSASSPSSNLTWTNSNGSSTGNVLLATTGNVGIGTIAPGSPLEINSTTDNIMRLRQQGGGWNYMEFYNDTVRTAYLGMDTSNNLSMNGQLVVNTISGNVGIGTATPGAAVGMSGGLTINGTNATKITVEDNGVPAYALNTSTGAWTMFDKVGGTWNSSLSSSGGNIGIGTTSPAAGYKLAVNGHGVFDNSASTYTQIRLGHEASDTIFADNTPTKIYGGGMWFRVSDASVGSFYRDVMSLAENGNVGIGTMAPKSQLSVTNTTTGTPAIPALGSAGTYASIYLTNSDTSYGLLGGSLYNGNSWLQVQTTAGTATAYNMLLQPNGGNVGIGTTTPESKLQTIGSMYVNTTADTTGGFYYGPSGLIIGKYSTSPWPGSNGLYVGGKVGIQTAAAPLATLAVNGLGLIGGANQSAYDIGAGRIAAGGSIYSYGSMCVGNNSGDCSHATTGFVATTNTFRLGTKYFRDVGNSWIYMGSSAGDYNGMGLAADNIWANSTSYASQFIYVSDRRLKQNIVPLSDSLSKILSLNGYSFDWKKDGKHDIGVIAQEVEKVFPALVNINPITGMKGVEYGNLVAPIIEAIKELANNLKNNTTEIQSLKAENAVLKARLDAIEARLAK